MMDSKVDTIVSPDDVLAPVTLLVCSTCKIADEVSQDDVPRSGQKLYEALAAASANGQLAGLEVKSVECLSNCKRGCTIVLTGGERWTYVYGDLDPQLSLPDVLDGAVRYAQTSDGIVPWRERPHIFRKNCIARIPALTQNS